MHPGHSIFFWFFVFYENSCFEGKGHTIAFSYYKVSPSCTMFILCHIRILDSRSSSCSNRRGSNRNPGYAGECAFFTDLQPRNSLTGLEDHTSG